MPVHKVSTFLSEISTFFKKNNAEGAMDSHEITISERIWGAILELVAAITRIFCITDDEVLEAVVNESDELAHICELYKYKMVS